MEGKIIQKQKIDYLAAHFKKIVFLVVIIIVAAGYFFLLGPKYKEIRMKMKDIETKGSEQSALQDKLIQITKLRNTYKSIDQDDVKKINSALPDLPLKDELLTQLEALISQNGLLLTSLQIEDPQKAETQKVSGVGKVRISMDVVGTDYQNLKNILSVLEKNLRLLDIISLKFSPEGRTVSLEIVTYYIK